MKTRVKIPMVGGNYKHDSLPFDRQETINLFPETGGPQSKSPGILRRRPGKKDWYDGIGAPTKPYRYLYTTSGDRFFSIRGAVLIEHDSDGTGLTSWVINFDEGKASMVDNGTHLTIADRINLWSLDLSTDVISPVTLTGVDNTPALAFIDGYVFGFNPNSSNIGQFQHSALNDSTTWNAIDVYRAEGSPDKLVHLAALNRQLWIFGSKSFEVWYNRGGDNSTTGATWARIDGSFTDIGCASGDSVDTISGRIFWLGSSKEGENVIWMSGETYEPIRISDRALETKIAGYTTVSDAWGFTLKYQGHYFYGITFVSENNTFLYDMNEGLWFTWAELDVLTGNQNKPTFLTSAYFNRKNLVGASSQDKIWELDKDSYDDNSNPIVWERYFPYIQADNKRIKIYSLFIDILTGSGLLTGQGSDPKIQLRWSKDGGRTFGNWHEMSVGLRGEYNTQVIQRMLGIGRNWVFHIRSSEPIDISIQDNCYAEVEVCDT